VKDQQNFLSRATTILFIILIAELMLGGGGRLLAIGPVSLRMFLFGLAMIVTLVHLFFEQRIPSDYKRLVMAFFIMLSIGLLTGIINGAEKKYWWEDIKPLLYFLILPFFAIAVKGTNEIHSTVKLIKFSALIQAVAFFVLLLCIHTGVIAFHYFYYAVVKREEFFFRGELTFVYKGFLYLSIGYIFVAFTQKKGKTALLIFIFLAILFTFTRGFILALALTYALYYVMNALWWKFGAIMAISILILFSGKDLIGHLSKTIDNFYATEKLETSSNANTSLLGDREFSDSGRINQIEQVKKCVTPVSFLIGYGFGNGIPSRPVHMEISYLEIFHKQGILGLLFWGILLVMLFKKYKRAISTPIADAFFFSTIFVFFQSLTNQYINNPIGLSITLLTLVVLDKLKSPEPDIS
jgi:hypothetical protein